MGNGWTGTFSACTHYVDCWAGQTDQGDIHKGQNTGNGDTYYWSGTQQTLANTIALNTALAAAGIQVDGFDYEWVYKNGNANTYSGQTGGGAVDPFEVVVNVYDSNGNIFKTYKYDYGQNFSGWTYDTGTETFGTNFLDPSFFGNVEVLVTGKDIAGQAGYWGPEFRANESGLYVNYSANLCYNNPLYDATCPGYVTALFNQQCTQNPLYDPTCPGYKAANLSTQCAANPLYDAACPGYAAAYLADRCYYDPLYDVQCTGYQQAFFDQQCELDGQYDKLCPNYLDPDLVDLGTTDPVEEATSTDTQVGVAALDFTQTQPIVQDVPTTDVYVPEVQDEEVEAEETLQAGAAMAMEDDIEKEIKQIEAEANEGETAQEDDIEAELAALENETTPGEADGNVGTGESKQEDDIEKEIAELKAESKSKKKTLNKNDKIRLLLAKKANELTKKIENAVTLEQQMVTQRSLLALISFVPGFDYNKKDLPQKSFYPEKPTVDHAYARWFLNDPKFGAMEDLQYPKLRSN